MIQGSNRMLARERPLGHDRLDPDEVSIPTARTAAVYILSFPYSTQSQIWYMLGSTRHAMWLHACNYAIFLVDYVI